MALLPALRRDAPLATRTAPGRVRGAEPQPAAPAPVTPSSLPPLDDGFDLIGASEPGDADLLRRQAAFDQMLAERAELQREANAIRDLTMEQLKKDAEILKKWIEMI